MCVKIRSVQQKNFSSCAEQIIRTLSPHVWQLNTPSREAYKCVYNKKNRIHFLYSCIYIKNPNTESFLTQGMRKWKKKGWQYVEWKMRCVCEVCLWYRVYLKVLDKLQDWVSHIETRQIILIHAGRQSLVFEV